MLALVDLLDTTPCSRADYTEYPSALAGTVRKVPRPDAYCAELDELGSKLAHLHRPSFFLRRVTQWKAKAESQHSTTSGLPHPVITSLALAQVRGVLVERT
jgi:hypothetical protein